MNTPPNGDSDESRIEIQIDSEVMKGVFANVTNIRHSREEFLLDFLFLQQQPAAFGKLVSRIIVTPGHAKRLLIALQDNIRKYEEQFGLIDPGLTQPESRTLQ